MVNDSASKIEFNGFSGWENDKWEKEQSFNVKLTDAADAPAWLCGAFATGTVRKGSVFSGKWEGDGTFVASVGSAETKDPFMDYTVKGDISEWTGKFLMQ